MKVVIEATVTAGSVTLCHRVEVEGEDNVFLVDSVAQAFNATRPEGRWVLPEVSDG